jgi:UDP-N-acetylglucosamine 2-epimerase (non-hydrolysing)
MRIALVAGARPNFVKISPILSALRDRANLEAVVVHTGQHYDDQMSAAFFRELEIREPDRNLGVGSASHAVQTARIMEGFDRLMDELDIDLVAVVGDVNSTVACALTSVKRGTPVAHVEAGLRSFDWSMPEEVNRVLTDAMSSYLFTPSEDAGENLRREGKPDEQINFVGNVMVDTLLRFIDRAHESSRALERLGLSAGEYAVLTLHRPANVDVASTFEGILKALGEIQRELPVVYPVHPRSRKMITNLGLAEYAASLEDLMMVDPMGYLDFIELESRARFVMTDSGGVQEETTVLSVPCLTLRTNTERPITITHGTNRLVGTDPERIVEEARSAMEVGDEPRGRVPPLWDGRAAVRIADVLEEHGP